MYRRDECIIFASESHNRLRLLARAPLRKQRATLLHNHSTSEFRRTAFEATITSREASKRQERTSGVIWLKTMWSLAAICDLVQRWASTLMFTIVCSSWI